MKITCKDCKRTWTSLEEHMKRNCDHEKCKVLEHNTPKEKKVMIVPRQVRLRVQHKEVEVSSDYDPKEPRVFVEVPKVVVININPRGKR